MRNFKLTIFMIVYTGTIEICSPPPTGTELKNNCNTWPSEQLVSPDTLLIKVFKFNNLGVSRKNDISPK
jgi:hypothetical protein